jgi:hypothetical protein
LIFSSYGRLSPSGTSGSGPARALSKHVDCQNVSPVSIALRGPSQLWPSSDDPVG